MRYFREKLGYKRRFDISFKRFHHESEKKTKNLNRSINCLDIFFNKELFKP